MNGIITAIPTGTAAFIATNIDDILILTLFFAQVSHSLRNRQIVAGQYIGFSILILASLPAFFGSLLVPHEWIRLLGLVPVILGLRMLLDRQPESADEPLELQPTNLTGFASFIGPQTYNVAAITIANGSDNIGIYVPLFSNSAPEELLVILSVFFTLVGVWCYAAYKLTTLPTITQVLTGYGNQLIPCVLIGLGVFIVKESILLTALAFVTSYLWTLTLGRMVERSL